MSEDKKYKQNRLDIIQITDKQLCCRWAYTSFLIG